MGACWGCGGGGAGGGGEGWAQVGGSLYSEMEAAGGKEGIDGGLVIATLGIITNFEHAVNSQSGV